VKLQDRYAPDFYVKPRNIDAGKLLCLLEEHPHIAAIAEEQRASSIQGPRQTTVLHIHVYHIENYRRVVREVESLPHVAEV